MNSIPAVPSTQDTHSRLLCWTARLAALLLVVTLGSVCCGHMGSSEQGLSLTGSYVTEYVKSARTGLGSWFPASHLPCSCRCWHVRLLAPAAATCATNHPRLHAHRRSFHGRLLPWRRPPGGTAASRTTVLVDTAVVVYLAYCQESLQHEQPSFHC